MNGLDLRRPLLWSSLIIFLVAAFLLGAFKILDRDFWWHITAGKLMWQTGHLIQTDPFAYTREGLPYLATHEWLAQIVLYLVHRIGGTTGIILFRSVMLALTFFLLLALDLRRLWPNVALAITGMAAALPGFLERPQLFTFVIFTAQLVLALRYLDDDRLHTRRVLLLGMLSLQVIWVNVHGGAALVGLLLIGSLFLQRLATLGRERGWGALPRNRELRLLLGTGVACALALFLSPSGPGTLDYLHRLLTDRTIAFISEWRPREHGYFFFLGPLWVIALVPLLLTRRHVIFCGLVLLATGYLSLQAFRHEMLFVFTAVGIAIYQLRHQDGWQALLHHLLARPVWALVATILVAVPVAAFAAESYRQVVERDYLWGYGVFAPGKGAADFLEREELRGPLFNTYGIGGYLIHRFFPDPTRKVFIDGRNVDYGFDFMNEAFVAGHSPKEWRVIEDRWNLQVALIDYDAIKQPGWLSYSHVLDADPTWPMVYIDDWTAVYLKYSPVHAPMIDRQRYRLLTAEGLEFGWVLEKTPKDQWPQLEVELRRAIAASPESVKARALLGKLLLRQGRLNEVLSIADELHQLRSRRPEAWALRAAVAVTRQEYGTAGTMFERMLRLAGDDYPDTNYGAIADVFAKAGNERKAKRYRRLAQSKGQAVSSAPSEADAMPEGGTPATGSGAVGDLLGGMAEDIQTFNDQGVDLAQQGKRSEARAAFLRALMLDPGNPLTRSNLCALETEESNIDKAIEYGTRALERGAEFADAHYNLALALLRSDNIKEAKKEAERARELGREVEALLRVFRDAR